LTYAYDANGNRTVLGGTWARTGLPAAVASATYNAANHQLTFGDATLTYDLNGNLTSDGTSVYTWDARNRLTAISGGNAASFQYDGRGRRTSKTVNAAQTGFLYDGLTPVQELNGSTVVANLRAGLGIDEYLTRTDMDGSRHFLSDALGSTVALSDDTGGLPTSYTYAPFGAPSLSGSVTANAFNYTGRENDGTGLHYYRARYYHPTLQRFISEDPLEFEANDLNLYAYVVNQPTGLADPLGLEPVTISTAAALAVVCATGAIAGDVVVLSVSGRKATWGELAAGAGIGCTGGIAVLGAYAVAAGAAVAQATETGVGLVLAAPAAVKGAEFFSRWANRAPFDQATRQIGRFTEFAVSVPGRVAGSYTRWSKVVNQEGRTIRLYHDTYDAANRFLGRGIKVPGPERHVP
jgi:RHS repeat-associated protein